MRSRLWQTAAGYYFPVPKEAVDIGLYGEYLDYVGPWPSEEVARLIERRLLTKCERLSTLSYHSDGYEQEGGNK